jgi:hypothetical protein
MSGSKTRFGFSGGSDPPDPEETRAATTVLGHDIHLQLPEGVPPPRFPVAATPVPPPTDPPMPLTPPPAWAPPVRPTEPVMDMQDTNPRRQSRRPQESRFARVLGRWTKSGRFLSRSRMEMEANQHANIPRDTTGRNVLIVLLVAFFTFIVTLSVVKLRQRFAMHPIPPTNPASAPRDPPRRPAAPAAAPTASVLDVQPAALASPPSTAPLPAAAKGLGSPAPITGGRKAARSDRPVARPPAHLKGELLPLQP